MNTVIRLSGGSLGSEKMLVRCDLSEASSPVQVNDCMDIAPKWDSTPYQAANARHTIAGLAELGKQIAAKEMEDPDFDCEWEDVTALHQMVEMIKGHGPRFIGVNAEDEAQEWIDHGFDVDDANEWCKIGVWEQSVAARLRDDGLTPEQVSDAECELMDADDPDNSEFTDGSPIYSVCNNDTSIDVLIDACKKDEADSHSK